jgi:hypothetical protein
LKKAGLLEANDVALRAGLVVKKCEWRQAIDPTRTFAERSRLRCGSEEICDAETAGIEGQGKVSLSD